MSAVSYYDNLGLGHPLITFLIRATRISPCMIQGFMNGLKYISLQWCSSIIIQVNTENNKTAIICGSTYQKVPVIRRLNFELERYKVKISQNMV